MKLRFSFFSFLIFNIGYGQQESIDQDSTLINDNQIIKTFNEDIILNESNILGDGNINVSGLFTFNGGNLINDSDNSVAPELSFKGYRQSWRMGIDVANNGGSGDFVLLARDVPGFGVNDLIYMSRNKEGDNSITDTSGYPTLGVFLTPAFPDIQTTFATIEDKPNRTTVGIRRAEATTDNFMLGFLGSEDQIVDYGVKNNFEHSPFLKVRGDIEVLSDDKYDTSVLRLNANPLDYSSDFVIKNFYSHATGYEFRMFSSNGSNNFYKYNNTEKISTFNHHIIANKFSGDGSSLTNLTIENKSIDNQKLSDMTPLTIKGNNSTKEGAPLDLTSEQVRSLLNVTEKAYQTYVISLQAHMSNPEDNEICYFGNMPKAPQSESRKNKIYIRQESVLSGVEIFCYSEKSGSNEKWDLYLRVNDEVDYLISSVSNSNNERVFSNPSLNINLKDGDFIEIKSVNPKWEINPTETTFGGYIKLN